MNPHDIMTYRY